MKPKKNPKSDLNRRSMLSPTCETSSDSPLAMVNDIPSSKSDAMYRPCVR